MQIPRRAPRKRAVFFVLAFALVALFVVGTFGEAAGKVYQPRNDRGDRRNKALGEIQGANPANDCWSHHQGEGMRDVFIIYPIIPKQLKLNEPYDIPVQIINPWKQDVRKMQLDVTLYGDQVLSVEAAASSIAAKQDIFIENQTVVGNPNLGGTQEPARKTMSFEVPAGAAAISASVELKPRGQIPQVPGAPGLGADNYQVRFRTPADSKTGGKDFATNPPNNTAALNRHFVGELKQNGTFFVDVEYKAGNAVATDVFFNATIIRGSGGSGAAAGAKTYTINIPQDAVILKGGAPYEATVRVTPFALGSQAMEFHGRAEIYYKHQLTSTPNEDFYNRYQNLSEDTDFIVGSAITPQRKAVVGSTFEASEFGGIGATKVEEQWQFVLAETSGFGAAGLLLPSLLLGGTYGKASRRVFNTILGGAKRRVMFHNLVSLALSFVAFLHIILFVQEIRYTILMGVMWGGLGALSLMVLGLTGYYQVPLIQRHGYKWWRFTHLAFGLLVIVFLSYHMVADGPDFFFIKEQLPKWINDVNLAQK